MNRTIIALAGLLTALAVPSWALTAPALSLSDGVNTLTIDSTGAVAMSSPCSCSTAVSSASAGTVTWSGQIGDFTVSSLTARSKPVLGSASSPTMDVSIGEILTGNIGGTLTIMWSDQGFTTIGPLTLNVVQTVLGGTGNYTIYSDPGNTLFATTTQAVSTGSTAASGMVLTGTGPSSGPFSVTEVQALTLGAGAFLNNDYQMTGASAPPVTATCASITATAGLAINPVTLTATGGSGSGYTFSATGLPAGLTMSASGTISGTPTASGTFNYTVTVTDNAGNTGTTNCSVNVATPIPSTTSCTLPYPTGSAPKLSSVTFNESGVLQAFQQSSDATRILAWFSDEHAPLLGASAVTVVTSAGSTTTNYPFTAYNSTTLMAYNPAGPLPVGNTNHVTGNGVVAGVDTSLQSTAYANATPSGWSGRPLWPALFITDLTVNGMSSIAGDWQQGGTAAVPPNGIYGAWKGATITLDQTKSPAAMTVTTDADPSPNSTTGAVPPGIPDVPSNGIGQSLGYFTEAAWNVSTLGLTPGHVYRIQVIVHDGDQNQSGGDVGEACLSPVYIPVYPLFLSSASLPAASYGSPYSTSAVAASGGTPTYANGVASYTYTITSGSLPAGLSLNASTGVISGVPLPAGVTNPASFNGSYPIMILASDSAGHTVSNTYTLNVGPEAPLSLSCAVGGSSGQVGSSFGSAAPTATGGVAPYTFSVGSGVLPPGLSLNPATGSLSGAPATIGNFSVKVSDSLGNSAGNCSYSISACLLPSLGTASSYSVFGLSNAKVNVQTSLGSGVSVGVASGAQLHLQGSSVLSGSVVSDPGATVQLDPATSISGGRSTTSLVAAQSAALAAAASFAALTPTQIFAQQINSGVTITGNGGRNVIAINGQVNLNNNGNLTISGGANDTFIFNIAAGQNVQLQNGSSIVLNGVSPSQVVFNFVGNGNLQVQSGAQGNSNTAGIFLNPAGQINVQGGTHNSVFISGNQIQFSAAAAGPAGPAGPGPAGPGPAGPGPAGPAASTPVTMTAVICPGPASLTLSCPLNVGDPNAAYQSFFTAIGGLGPYTYSLAGSGFSPAAPGLSLNSSTGVISGTLPGTLPITFTGTVTDSNSTTVQSPVCTIGQPCVLKSLGLGSGAATTFSVLALPGSGPAGAKVNIQNPVTGSPVVGLGAGAQLQVNGPGNNFAGAVYQDPSASIQLGPGDAVSGTRTKQSFSTIDSTVSTAATTLGMLAPTQTISQPVDNTVTIVGNGGQNVIALNAPVNLNNGQNLVISGGSDDTFIINVEQGQNMVLQNGSSIVLVGVKASQVLFNFLGTGSNLTLQSGPPGQSNSAGVFLNPGGQIHIQGGSHNSVFISGNQVQIQSTPQGNASFTAVSCN